MYEVIGDDDRQLVTVTYAYIVCKKKKKCDEVGCDHANGALHGIFVSL